MNQLEEEEEEEKKKTSFSVLTIGPYLNTGERGWGCEATLRAT
jgi:hypothetical protein